MAIPAGLINQLRQVLPNIYNIFYTTSALIEIINQSGPSILKIQVAFQSL